MEKRGGIALEDDIPPRRPERSPYQDNFPVLPVISEPDGSTIRIEPEEPDFRNAANSSSAMGIPEDGIPGGCKPYPAPRSAACGVL
jgi:hypothetical protein